MPFMVDRLDPMEMPRAWHCIEPSLTPTHAQSNDSIHLLSYPFLFPPAAIVAYFRSINLYKMSCAFKASRVNERLLGMMTSTFLKRKDHVPSLYRLKRFMRPHLVLNIRRKHLFRDAMDQLWRRERRELLLPLKVRLGMDDGELGVDHGGVQQEFFRIAIGIALDPEYGMPL